MGWADLARIINTHWGKPASSDPSSLWYNCKLLGRKVKPETRPDYYPALALINDTLEADVLNCWRLLLKTHDLDAYFDSLDAIPTGPELFALAEVLVSRWALTHAHDIATLTDEYWEGPTSSLPTRTDDDSDSDEPLQHKRDRRHSKPDPTSKNTKTKQSRKRRKTEVSPEQLKGFRGDHCLANSIVRLRDSLWHYEFVYAIADGDIGRAMKVMSAWLFTFTGSGAAKYATELLELSAGFLYEFPPELQEALM
ncbi:hypothetical protein FRC09_006111 [Ceratobasidium sp. 395]|nr:hypothetical protein FRC09_006111 [Ceratobasidium sp. 395]